MKIAFVVQRYGVEVAGGAEALCRQTAHALATSGHQIVIYTTTARDYLHWSSFYAEGYELDGRVEVLRYNADPADPVAASRLGRELGLGWGDWHREVEWARAQGPISRPLLEDVAEKVNDYDAVALWTYLYATTQLAMPLVSDRAILVPTAHDEPMFRFRLTRGLMALAAGFAFLTPEEQQLAAETHAIAGRPQMVVGAGLHPTTSDRNGSRRLRGLPPRFALYLGRVDPGKGIESLFVAHAAYRAAGGTLELVLAGRRPDGVHVPDWVLDLGFVDEPTKATLLATCEVLVLPSVNESLSLVLMEAWQVGTPTLAIATNPVLAAQTARSGGGLVYRDAADYRDRLTLITENSLLRARLSTQGSRWATGQTWEAVTGRWEALVAAVALGRAGRAGSGTTDDGE